MTIPLATVVAGLVAGLGIGGLAAALVLVYRADRVINLAQVETGAAAAALCAWLSGPAGLAFPPAAAVSVLVAAVVGAGLRLLVVGRVGRGSPAAVMIATAGAGELFLAAGLVLIAGIGNRRAYPVPFTLTLHVGTGVVLHGADVLLAGLVPLLAGLLALVLRLTRIGSAIRAATDNPEAARLAGVPVAALSALAWAAGAGLSAVVVILLLAGRPIVGTEALGPQVLFAALAAALLARFADLPRALGAGVAIGVIQQVVAYNWPGGGDLVLLAVAGAAAVLLWRPGVGRRDDPGSGLAVAVLGPRGHGVAAGLALGAVAGAGLLWATNRQALTLTEIAAYATLAISATVIVGLSGQISLGQVAFFGVGAAVSYQLSASVGLPFWLAFLGAGVFAAAASVLVGLPALRAPGPVFAVTSLGFALVAVGWLLPRPWLLGSGVVIPRPLIGPVDLAAERPYFVFALVVLAAAAALTSQFLRRSPGRRAVAVRDNEAAAATFAIPVVATKVLGFALAGFLAGVAGAVYGHGLQSVSVNDFPVVSPGLQIGAVDGLRILAITVIGGLGSVWGAVAGAALIVGVDELTTSVALRLATTGAGLLIVLLVAPDGLVGLAGLAARAARRWRARHSGRAARRLRTGRP